MPLVTAAEFSRMCKVSKVAVSKAPPSKIVKTPEGKVDILHPTNAKYLAEHTGMAHAPKPKPMVKTAPKPKAKADTDDAAEQAQFQKAVAKRQAKKIALPDTEDLSPTEKAERKKLAQDIAELMADTADLDRQKKVADIALKKAMEARHTFKLASDKKNVISREEFRRVAEGWNTQLAQTVMRVPRRVVARLWAMAKAGDEPRDGEAYLEKALSAAVTRALEGVTKAAK